MSADGDFGPAVLRACLSTTSEACTVGSDAGSADELICFQSVGGMTTLDVSIVEPGWSITSIEPSDGVGQSATEASSLSFDVDYTVNLEQADSETQVTLSVRLIDANLVSVSLSTN